MPYLFHQSNDFNSSRAYNYLKHLGVTKNNSKVLYYLISYFVFTLLVFTFEIPLVYRITNSIESLLIGHFFYYVSALVGFLGFYILKLKLRVSSLFRFSMILNFLVSIYLVIFYTKLVSLPYIIGMFIIRGLGVSSYAIAFNSVFMDGLKDKQRDSFSLLFRSVHSLLPVIIPILSGYIISSFDSSFRVLNIYNEFLPFGYFIIFFIGSILSLVFSLYAPKLPLYEDFSGGINFPFKLLFNKKIAPIRNYLIFNAGVDSLKLYIYGLLGFLILSTELNLGIFSSILALIGSIYFLFISKIEKSNHIKRIKFFFLGLLGDVVTQILLLFNVSLVTLAIRSVGSTLITPLKAVFGINMIRKRYDEYSEILNAPKISFILFQELAYFIGRLISFSLMLFTIVFITKDLQLLFKICLLVFIIVDTIEYFFIKEIRKL